MSLQEFSGSSPKRRRAEEKDEGIGSPDTLEEEKLEEVRREMLELRQQLDKERTVRIHLEEQVRRQEEMTCVLLPVLIYSVIVIFILTVTVFMCHTKFSNNPSIKQ